MRVQWEGMTATDYLSRSAQRVTGMGEYLGAKTSEGFDNTTTKQALVESRVARMEKEAFGETPADYEGELTGLVGVTTQDIQNVREASSVQYLSEDEWRGSEWFREEVPYAESMTPQRAHVYAEEYDRRRYRDSLVERAPDTALHAVFGFGAAMLGTLPDPVNLLAFGGVGPGTSVARAAAIGAAENAVGNLAVDAAIFPQLRAQGEDVGFVDAALDVAFGAALGAGLGGAAQGLTKLARRRVGGKEREAVTQYLEAAAQDLQEGRPVNMSAYDSETAGIHTLLQRVRSETQKNDQVFIHSDLAATLDQNLAEIVVDSGSWKEKGELLIPAQKYGLVKIVAKHGESAEPPGYAVRDADVLGLPRVLREFEPASMRGEIGEGTKAWNWAVRREDGKQVIYSLKPFTSGDKKTHLVTMYVPKDGERIPWSKKRFGQKKSDVDVPGSSSGSIPDGDTALGARATGLRHSSGPGTTDAGINSMGSVDGEVNTLRGEDPDTVPREVVEIDPRADEDISRSDYWQDMDVNGEEALARVEEMRTQGRLLDQDVSEMQTAELNEANAERYGEGYAQAAECIARFGT